MTSKDNIFDLITSGLLFIVIFVLLINIDGLREHTSLGEYLIILLIVIIMVFMATDRLSTGMDALMKISKKNIIQNYLEKQKRKNKKKLENL